MVHGLSNVFSLVSSSFVCRLGFHHRPYRPTRCPALYSQPS
uniref:Uncharacterized protein n=1 Tax=Anguilla anguilla TaxID=7936 RepID=A0A0E9QMX3_ANGAN